MTLENVITENPNGQMINGYNLTGMRALFLAVTNLKRFQKRGHLQFASFKQRQITYAKKHEGK